MKHTFRLVILAMLVTIVGGIVPAASVAVAQDAATQPLGMVSGAWQMMAWQLAIAPEFPEHELEARDGRYWAMLLADMTNTGVASGISVADVKLGKGGVGGDPVESVRISRELGFTQIGDDGVLPVAENGIARVAVVFDYSGDPQDLTVTIGEQKVSVVSVISDALDVADLPEAPAAMQLVVGTIQAVGSAGNWTVTIQQTGESREVVLPGIQAPPIAQCYGAESVQLLNDTTAGTVWIETVSGLDTPTVWYNDVANATFGLLSHTLVTAAAADADGGGVYGSWLAPISDQVEADKAGLWQNCKSADGTYINPPTPTPVPTPSAEEIRAQYNWVDTRDLISRPFMFEGEKIAISGEVFTLDVDSRGTGMQIWVDTPNGREAVVVLAIGNQTPGLYEGMWVTVYGIGQGVFTGTNGFGATITQPMIQATFIDY